MYHPIIVVCITFVFVFLYVYNSNVCNVAVVTDKEETLRNTDDNHHNHEPGEL